MHPFMNKRLANVNGLQSTYKAIIVDNVLYILRRHRDKSLLRCEDGLLLPSYTVEFSREKIGHT